MIIVKNLKKGDTIWVLVYDYHDGYHNHFKPVKAKFIKARPDGDDWFWIDYTYASNGQKDFEWDRLCFRTKKEAVAYNKLREKGILTEKKEEK
jgi:hypothetical protein